MAFVQSPCCAESDLSVSASRELNRLRILFDKCGDALLAAHYLVDMLIEGGQFLAECREHFLLGRCPATPLTQGRPDLVEGKAKILRLVDEGECFQDV